MMTVVFGGASSGKSDIAENIAKTQGKKLCYIATMMPFSAEAKERVKKHQLKRICKGFCTIEKYTDIGQTKTANFDAALLECVGNLLANEMFLRNGNENVVERVVTGIETLNNNVENLVVVTNDVFKGGFDYGDESKKYIDNYAKITSRLFEMADTVIETKCGIEIYLKRRTF